QGQVGASDVPSLSLDDGQDGLPPRQVRRRDGPTGRGLKRGSSHHIPRAHEAIGPWSQSGKVALHVAATKRGDTSTPRSVAPSARFSSFRELPHRAIPPPPPASITLCPQRLRFSIPPHVGQFGKCLQRQQGRGDRYSYARGPTWFGPLAKSSGSCRPSCPP